MPKVLFDPAALTMPPFLIFGIHFVTLIAVLA
jgi:hypothetical protein